MSGSGESSVPLREGDEQVKATYHGIHEWFKHVFEHYGWMILCAKDKKDSHKIKAYKEGINHLLQQIKLKRESVKEEDRKADLDILYNKVITLKENAQLESNLGSFDGLVGGAQKSKTAAKKSKSKSKSKSKKVKKSKANSKSKSKNKSKKVKKSKSKSNH